MPDISEAIRKFLLETLGLEKSFPQLSDETPLISTSVLTSIDIPRLINFLESTFGIEIYVSEDRDFLDTVAKMSQLVRSRTGSR